MRFKRHIKLPSLPIGCSYQGNSPLQHKTNILDTLGCVGS